MHNMHKIPSVDTEKHPNVSIYEIDEEFLKEADRIISTSNNSVPEFWRKRYEADNAKNWDTFYKHNQANFFKDRHYIVEEFGLRAHIGQADSIHVVDLGCGVGNAILPLLQEFPNAAARGFDCAASAIDILKYKLIADGMQERCKVSTGDLTDKNFPYQEMQNTGDLALLFFVQSAIDPAHYENIQEIAWQVLKPGGSLLFRDYGLYDMAQLRFETSASRQGNRISDNFYVRGDGTRAKFFTEIELKSIWEKDDRFRTDHIVTHAKKIVNRKTGVEMKRVWIQAKWIKN